MADSLQMFGVVCGGVLIIFHATDIWPLTSHPYKAGTEHAGFSPDQARNQINHQARSAVMCSVSRMKGELHPAKIVRPKAYLIIYLAFG